MKCETEIFLPHREVLLCDRGTTVQVFDLLPYPIAITPPFFNRSGSRWRDWASRRRTYRPVMLAKSDAFLRQQQQIRGGPVVVVVFNVVGSNV